MKLELGNIIDTVGKYLGRIKTISIGVLLLLFILTSAMNGCERKRAEELFEKVTGLKVENAFLLKKVGESDKEIDRLSVVEDSLNKVLASREAELKKLRTDYGGLKRKYDDLASQIITIPVEESYEFLDKEAYPYSGEKKFPFNEPQVKGIHLTFLQKIELEKQNTNLLGQVSTVERMLSDMNSLYSTSKAKENEYLENATRYKNVVSNMEKASIYTEDELKKLRRQNKVLRYGVYGGTAIGLLTGILLMK